MLKVENVLLNSQKVCCCSHIGYEVDQEEWEQALNIRLRSQCITVIEESSKKNSN